MKFQPNNTPWNKGKHWSKGYRQRISQKLKGIKLPKEVVAKMSAYQKTHTNSGRFVKGKCGYWSGKKRPDMQGSNNHFWRGGLTAQHIKIRNSLELKLWRKAVFERDNFTCQKYGFNEKNITAHHINNFSEYPELRFAIDNGITLSRKAHREFHHIYGIKNNTRKQLEEFLSIP